MTADILSTDSGARAARPPLRIVVASPLAGTNPDRPKRLIRVGEGGVPEAMKAIAPRLDLPAPLSVSLRFSSLEDFLPERLAQQAPAAAAALDPIFRHPAFRDLESAWRGLAFLVERGRAGGAGASLVLDLFVTGPGADDFERLQQMVLQPEYDQETDPPMSALVADLEFDAQPASIDRLRRIGQYAAVLQAPFVAAVGAPFFGLKNLAHLPTLPDLSTRTTGGVYAAWEAFQKEDAARWVSLTANRFLLRAPHGADAPPAAGGYKETVDPAHPEWLPWGRGVWAVAGSLAGSYAEHGHCAAIAGLSGTGGHPGLPTRAVTQANKTTRVTSEIVLDDQKAWELVRAGFTPILGMADGDTAYFPFIGNVFRPRPNSVTIDQTLSYHLYLGQLTHAVLPRLGSLPAGDPAAAAKQLEAELFAVMSPYVGAKPGEGVVVAAQTATDGTAILAIRVTPTFKVQDKPVELTLSVPIR